MNPDEVLLNVLKARDNMRKYKVISDKTGEVEMWLERLAKEHDLSEALLEATAIVVERAMFRNIQSAEIATASRILEPELSKLEEVCPTCGGKCEVFCDNPPTKIAEDK